MKITIVSLFLLSSLAGGAQTVAAAEIAVIVNPQNQATRMFSEQAAQFFIGKSTQFTPIDASESSPIRAEFYERVVGKSAAQVKAIWSKLVFTGKGSAPKEYATNAEIKKAVAADINAIAYIEKSAVDDTVKVLMTSK